MSSLPKHVAERLREGGVRLQVAKKKKENKDRDRGPLEVLSPSHWHAYKRGR